MSSMMYVVMEQRTRWDQDGDSRTETRPVGVFFDEAHAAAWCDQQPDLQLYWVDVPVLDA